MGWGDNIAAGLPAGLNELADGLDRAGQRVEGWLAPKKKPAAKSGRKPAASGGWSAPTESDDAPTSSGWSQPSAGPADEPGGWGHDATAEDAGFFW